MIIHDVEQGSLEWLDLRSGMPTASEFSKIITPKKQELSKSARSYAYRLIAEKLLGYQAQSLDGIQAIEQGKEREPHAVKAYEFGNDITSEKVGFVTLDDGTAGASPDRFIMDRKRCLEIKCPVEPTMIGYMVSNWGTFTKDVYKFPEDSMFDDAYITQKQGQNYICETEACELFAWNPGIPHVHKVFWRDEKFITNLATALEDFNFMKEAMIERIQREGIFAERQRIMGAREAAYSDNIDKLLDNNNYDLPMAAGI